MALARSATAPTRSLLLGWKSATWVAAGVFTAQVLIGLLHNIPGSLLKVGIGLLFAFALDPLVVRARDRFGVSRPVAVAIVGSVAVALVALLVVVVGPPAVAQAQQFGRELPQTVEAMYDLPLVGPRLEAADASGKVVEWIDGLPARIDAQAIGNAAERLLTGVVTMITVLLVAITLLVDGDRLVRRLLAMIPDSVEPQAVPAGRIFTRTIGAYFSGSILVAICAGAFILAAGLALGIPLAPAAGLWAIAVNMIPQIGGLLTGGFFAILGFSVSPTRGIICAVVYFVYMEFENYVLGPAIVGQAVDLSPPATLIAALIGGATAGVVGAMASTPLCGAIKAIYHEVRYGDDRRAPPGRPGLLDRLKRLRRKKEPPPAPEAATACDLVTKVRAHIAAGDCERIRPGLIAQPVNTASSLAYVAAGALVARRARGDDEGRPRRRRLALAAALAAVGIGSVAYHGPGGRWGRAAHDGSIMLLVATQSWRVAAERRRPDPLAGSLTAVAVAIHATSRTGGPLCRPDSLLQGHALWHVLSAAAAAIADAR